MTFDGAPEGCCDTHLDAGARTFGLRIDKRAVWKGWLLDFYVSLINLALMPEENQ